ncbi:BnaC06g03240D [Brassica napus]|uniref:BnaC06g03240D protein n=1 Tax=Brassica napus TaxID=3708 RepID=A0A078GU23_BRANA|nr:BnaC06g03240D [Brassica napus]
MGFILANWEVGWSTKHCMERNDRELRTELSNARRSDCNLVYSAGPYGENLAKGSSSTFSAISAVNLWVSEKPYYNYTTNSCTGGKHCFHYTQVVWRDSVKLGCARLVYPC